MTLPKNDDDSHYAWCEDPTSHRDGMSLCVTPVFAIPGVNVATSAQLWLAAEDFWPLTPTAAQLELAKGEAPLNGTLYLDVRGLRELAETATKLADLLEGMQS